MLEYPVHVRLVTEENRNYFENISAAEAAIGALISAEEEGWLRLHGFVVLPNAMEIVMSPIRQGISGVIAYVQAEMMPILHVLLPEALLVWNPNYDHNPLVTQEAMDARLEMMMLAPVALNIVEEAEEYPYSFVNERYVDYVTRYTGFARMLPPDEEALMTGINPVIHDFNGDT